MSLAASEGCLIGTRATCRPSTDTRPRNARVSGRFVFRQQLARRSDTASKDVPIPPLETGQRKFLTSMMSDVGGSAFT
jgi:hypothetical protein